MTDGETMLDVPSGTPPTRANRVALVAGGTVGVVLLATIGAIIGWGLAGPGPSDRDPRAGSAADAASPSLSATQSEDTSEPTVTGEVPPGPADKPTGKPSSRPQRLPDLVGRDFRDARKELRRQHLGWSLVFGSDGPAGTVTRTDPPAGSPAPRGTTVRLTVAGAAPAAKIPDVVGMACGEARDKIVDNGLYPAYPNGESGAVTRQDPEPSGTAVWNDRVRIWCGQPTDPGTPTPAP